MKTKTMAVWLAGASLCAATAAHAQAPTPPPARAQAPVAADAPPPKPITIKLGAFFPSSGDVKDAVGSTFFSAGAEYAFVNKEKPSAVLPLVYVDYAGRSKKRSVNDGAGTSVSLDLTASTVGIGPGVRYYVGAPGAGSVSPYVGAGVGVYFDHVKAAANVTSGGQSGSASDSLNKTRVGFKVNAGVEFNQSYLLEVNYTNAGSVEGTRIDGFGVQAGLRF